MKNDIMLTTTETIPGKELEILGMVRGDGIQTNSFSKARADATKNMVKVAQNKQADAIISIRYASSPRIKEKAEILAYGTAVKFK